MQFTEKIKEYDQVISQEMFEKLPHYLQKKNWGLNASDPQYQPHKKFWGMILSEEPFFNQAIFSRIKTLTERDFTISRIIANAQSTLQDGSPHHDDISANSWTFILYCNSDWDYQWGGQTVFFDRYRTPNGEIDIVSNRVHNVYPIPNTGVLFPGNMMHYAQGPNRDFYEVRYSVAWHLKEI